jgi:hypothetical protein
MSPMLPFETISHIIKLALPLPGRRTVAERSSILRACALVSAIWRDVAQAELFASVVVGNRETKDLFLRTTTDRPTLGWRINTLRILAYDRWEPHSSVWLTDVDFNELVLACPRVETLRLSGATHFAFDLSILQCLPRE